jgi:AcrR family transcriptional regulator
MASEDRRRRDREARHRLIVASARELAESEGWEAVTTRRLAERVEYSQPVLYSHFANKEAIVRAVAVEGFVELAARMRTARENAGPDALLGVGDAYLSFATQRPALYDAMFSRPVALRFGGGAETPAPLQEGFGELLAALPPGPDSEIRAELFWSSLHGLATLTRSGRLRPEHQAERLGLLVRQYAGHTGA